MRVAVNSRNSWTDLRQKAVSELGLDGLKTHIYFYRGIEHALSEVCTGITQQFPHRKKAYYLEGMSPYIERPMKQLSMSSYNVTAKSIDLLTDLDEFKESLSREDLFVLYSQDDPVTAELFNLNELEASVLEKKLYSIKICHQYLGEDLKSMQRTQLHIYPIHEDLCVVVAGLRGRLPDMVAGGMKWTDKDLSEAVHFFKNPVAQNKDLVTSFEASNELGARPNITHESRVFDRAVLTFKDMDGHAFIHYLAKELGQPLQAPGADNIFECTSRSRWQDPKLFSWLSERGFSENELRGLVVLSLELLTEENQKVLLRTREKVLSLQGVVK